MAAISRYRSREKSPLTDPLTADVAGEEVAAILARHAATLELLRRAADKPGCRFIRDWSRPSLNMLSPEHAALRRWARLLALAARSEAAGEDDGGPPPPGEKRPPENDDVGLRMKP